MNDRFLSRGKLKADNFPHKKGDWVFGCFVEFNYGDGANSYIYGYGKVIPKTVGACTGLTDKNKKLMFEGDIVSLPDEDEIGVIKWDDDTAMFIIDDSCIVCNFDNYYGYELEVIGNIYDNQEMIGDAKK